MLHSTEGHLISKGLFCVFKYTEKPIKCFRDLCLSSLFRGYVFNQPLSEATENPLKNFASLLADLKTPKSPFEINRPLLHTTDLGEPEQMSIPF